MTAYVDTSVLLRIILEQPKPLSDWTRIERGIASVLVRTECLRALDRLRIQLRVPEHDVGRLIEKTRLIVSALELVALDHVALDRAADPIPIPLGSLDAIHLASALLWRESTGEELIMATHDAALGLAARAYGFKVIGVA